LLKEGDKNKKGSYYTPENITGNISTVKVAQTSKILDPCCGTGSFLLSFANKITDPQKLYGIDIDDIACFIAKINLVSKYKHLQFRPNIFNVDFLNINNSLDNFPYFRQGFDVIVTNPPWGALVSAKYAQYFPQIFSREIFSYFIVKARECLKKEGRGIFVLPASILNVAAHKDIRKHILANFNIEKIIFCGKAFKGVLTDVICLSLRLKTQRNFIKILNKTGTKIIRQSVYETNVNHNFMPNNMRDEKILKKLFAAPYDTLTQSQWGLGIVTGNNAKHISPRKK
jgi:type I restriction-modification system DNA methylase subunit